ncbi:type I restriction endonuclease subunit S [Photobacterium damselae subsp. damselae]|nr:type I restriction endonuclease subunit S [Photobacterium damselae subsp. damselae]
MTNTMIEQLPKYESYKDSGVEWLGEIPSEWNLLPGFRFFTENKRSNKGMIEETVLSLSYGKIIVKPKEKLVGLVPESFETYQIVEPGDIIVRCTDLQNDKVSLRTGLALNDGIITSAYLNLKVANDCEPRYLHYFLHSLDTTKVIYKFGSGLRQNLSYLDFKRLPVFDISQNVQRAIADFLDIKTSQIDEAIAIKQKQIELLKERKQIIIQQVVTRGLNPNAPMKDSGVDWIGEIPEHWIVKRAKYLLDEINERSETGLEELLSVSHMTGVTPRSEKNVTMFMAEDYTGSKLCHSGDLVINIMWAWMGALGVSDRTGIVSPSYGVFREQHEGTFIPKYLEMLLKSTKYVEYYNKVSTGLHSSRLRFYGHMLFDMALGFPPYEEQTQIVEYISRECSKVDEAITVQAEQVSKLKEYKTTLINSAVTGKIKVTELA